MRPCLNETDLNLLNVYDDARLVARAAPRAALTALVKPEFRAPIGAPAPNPSYAAHTHKSWGGNSFTAVKIIMIYSK